MSHKLFKIDYKLSSGRIASTMEENFNKVMERSLLESGSRCIHDARKQKPNISKLRAIGEDGPYIVKSSKGTTIAELELARRVWEEQKRDYLYAFDVSKHVSELPTILGADRLSSLLNVLKETFESIAIDQKVARHVKLNLPASEYVSGY